MNQMNVSTTGVVDDVAVERSFLMRVYAWMALALLISAAVAYSTAVAPEMLLLPLLRLPGGMLILFGVQLALVLGLSFGLRKLNASVATGLFLVYAAVTGLTLHADLAHLAQGAQEKTPIGVAVGDLDAPPGLGQGADRMPSQEPRTAKDGDLFCFHGENPVERGRV